MNPLVRLADLGPGEQIGRAEAALGHYSLRAVAGADDPLFEAGYDFLAEYFGHRGELERREILEGWASRPRRRIGDLDIHYRMLLALAPDGSLAAARDCYAALDAATGVVVVYLAHALVAPAHRRGGLAALLRGAGASLGRQILQEHGLDPDGSELLLAVEQEPIDAADPDSHIRLSAYGKAGFQAIDPAWLPYCQPDFRDLEALGEPARPLPLLAVVRRVGREAEPTLPAALAAAWVSALYAVFSSHCRPRDLAPLLAHTLGTLASTGAAEVPLVPLPRSPEEAPRCAPLLRERVLGFFPAL